VTPGRAAAVATVAALLLAGPARGAPPAGARVREAAVPRAWPQRGAAPRRAERAPQQPPEAGAAPARSPSSPPLVGGYGLPVGPAEAEARASPQEADPLVSNGLGSPLCRGTLPREELSAQSRSNCETSGFIAAASPTGNFGIDVHIDTGLFGISEGAFLSAVQDLFVTPFWMALVWAVHALVVMLEWCFTVDLLDSPSVALGAGLRAMQANLTEPWLAGVLAVASVLAAYNGLVRRRVSDTLGQTLMAGAMMIGGLWVTLDPTATVGALGGWANQASLGTLAASARGSPDGAGRTLGDSMASLFAATIEVPWCYLEFGDVGWCRDPARLDPRLRAAGLKIASRELEEADCGNAAAQSAACTSGGGGPARALRHSAQLLRAAKSNGAIFLALPANGPERNSINDEGSLLRVMCQSSQATRCQGPMAAQAEFRTNGGTLKRVAGLVLIVAGVLGMLLLVGFIALRLIGAAIFSLLYLLLAPAMVLAPALGESGRLVFRRWTALLLGAVLAKLLFAFLLGVVLAVLAILAALDALGWWTQWLLMSAFWWGAFSRRHLALSIAGPASAGAGARHHAPRAVMRRAVDALAPARRMLVAAGAWRTGGAGDAASGSSATERVARVQRVFARRTMDAQVQRSLDARNRRSDARPADASELQAAVSAKRTQLERISHARAAAVASGDSRRAAELAHRAQRVKGEIAREQETVNALRGEARAAAGAPAAQQARFLDDQARLPRSGAGAAGGPARDYAALAGLAGYGRGQYERLDGRRQREARLEIDRELAARRELRPAVRDAAAAASGRATLRETRKARRSVEDALARRMRAAGQELPDSLAADGVAAWTRRGRARDQASGAHESSVMRDAREVAMRRKRQLGLDRP
jgi:hypothetical protein